MRDGGLGVPLIQNPAHPLWYRSRLRPNLAANPDTGGSPPSDTGTGTATFGFSASAQTLTAGTVTFQFDVTGFAVVDVFSNGIVRPFDKVPAGFPTHPLFFRSRRRPNLLPGAAAPTAADTGSGTASFSFSASALALAAGTATFQFDASAQALAVGSSEFLFSAASQSLAVGSSSFSFTATSQSLAVGASTFSFTATGQALAAGSSTFSFITEGFPAGGDTGVGISAFGFSATAQTLTAGSSTFSFSAAAAALTAATSSFSFTASAAALTVGSSTFEFTAVGISVAGPIAFDGTLTTSANTPANGTLIATSSLPLSYALVDVSNAHGSVVITNSFTGAYTYTPTTDYVGAASFTFQATERIAGGGTVFSLLASHYVQGMGVQSDGKIVLALDTSSVHPEAVLTVGRYTADGVLDQTFGVAGYFTMPSLGIAVADSLAIQSDDKIVVGGGLFETAEMVLVRLNADGTLDTTFNSAGTPGYIIPPTWLSGEGLFRLLIQPDGKILAGGDDANDPNHPAVIRFNTDGTIDTLFGVGGRAVVPTPTPPGQDVTSLALQSDGKIIVDGTSVNAGTMASTSRLNANGTMDGTFGVGGIVDDPFNTTSYNTSAIVLLDGRILHASSWLGNMILTMYTALGAMDVTWGTAGQVITDLGTPDDGLIGIKQQSDGKIVAVGWTLPTPPYTYSFAVLRFNLNGTLDNTFGVNGVATGDVLGYTWGGSLPIILASGKILVSGAVGDYNVSTQGGVLRYTSAGVLDTVTFGEYAGLSSNIATISITVTAIISVIVICGEISLFPTMTATVSLFPAMSGSLSMEKC